ncbi:TPA: hypothetical protein JAN90_03440 [Legionella pneumophila]|uniref:hypothetical protein n=1 Tax=Legionella sp. PATHC039 TaxID=2992042 RepID=UPI0007785A0E|nr:MULTISPECIES: hypothetical protein [Legionella]HAT8857395.1 hypothetical protein [Legionella pneumophila subsp. pneumophila]MCW8394801.1 hypothetical protein [Legionella sp. PATHC039]HAT7071839.1 hypothetical protein [Legionella pneumophila]HAT8640258.1 hypothetical protein [Legionella pneumophila]HAT8866939.1 hypothetical protein [Legionella pneumophila subsp. pneumophila]
MFSKLFSPHFFASSTRPTIRYYSQEFLREANQFKSTLFNQNNKFIWEKIKNEKDASALYKTNVNGNPVYIKLNSDWPLVPRYRVVKEGEEEGIDLEAIPKKWTMK